MEGKNNADFVSGGKVFIGDEEYRVNGLDGMHSGLKYLNIYRYVKHSDADDVMLPGSRKGEFSICMISESLSIVFTGCNVVQKTIDVNCDKYGDMAVVVFLVSIGSADFVCLHRTDIGLCSSLEDVKCKLDSITELKNFKIALR